MSNESFSFRRYATISKLLCFVFGFSLVSCNVIDQLRNRKPGKDNLPGQNTTLPHQNTVMVYAFSPGASGDFIPFTSRDMFVGLVPISKLLRGDFDSDGRDDLVYMDGMKISFMFSTRTNRPSRTHQWKEAYSLRESRDPQQFYILKSNPAKSNWRDKLLDNNGATFEWFTWDPHLNQGSWSNNNMQSMAGDMFWECGRGNQKFLIGDFNGDGHQDIFLSEDGRWKIRYFLGGNPPLYPDLRDPCWTTVNHSDANINDLLVGDFNGDGKDDIMYTTGSKWMVNFSANSRHMPDDAYDVITWIEFNTAEAKAEDLKVGDFNGDGKSDILWANGNRWRISWGATSIWETVKQSEIESNDLIIGDFDGDGKDDVMVRMNMPRHMVAN